MAFRHNEYGILSHYSSSMYRELSRSGPAHFSKIDFYHSKEQIFRKSEQVLTCSTVSKHTKIPAHFFGIYIKRKGEQVPTCSIHTSKLYNIEIGIFLFFKLFYYYFSIRIIYVILSIPVRSTNWYIHYHTILI